MAARKKAPDPPNPLTGKAPNTFTQVTNRELPAPVNVQQFKPDVTSQRRLRSAALEHEKSGGSDAQLGYRKPEGMSDTHFAWITGAQHMFPNRAAERGEPAINEPHRAQPGVTVQRRAEDLNSREYALGEDDLRQHGHATRNPTRSLRDTQQRHVNRVIGEHVQAGVNESASQLFYGGKPTSQIPDAGMAEEHRAGVMSSQQRFGEAVGRIAEHPELANDQPDLNRTERYDLAKHAMAAATADTSPQNKWRQKGRSPNLEQAEEASFAGMEGRKAEFVGGRVQNNAKAAARVNDIVMSGSKEIHQYGDPRSATKTIAFRGALVDQDAPDAFKVADVHEGHLIAPWLPTGKSKTYEVNDPQTGRQVGPKISLYPDQPKRSLPAGATRAQKVVENPATGSSREMPETGNSRVEAMLSEGKSTVHALNDRATREVLTNTGLSRGVNYADNVHSIQAATWGSEQVNRPDIDVTHADQYPVVRDWGSEGHADLNPMGEALFGVKTGGTLTPKYTRNPNRKQIENPARTKPYLTEPGATPAGPAPVHPGRPAPTPQQRVVTVPEGHDRVVSEAVQRATVSAQRRKQRNARVHEGPDTTLDWVNQNRATLLS